MQEGTFEISTILNTLRVIFSFLIANTIPIVIDTIVTLILREYVAYKANLRNERIQKYEKLIENIYGQLKASMNNLEGGFVTYYF